MARLFHVSSSTNRSSIEQFGLDSCRMGAATGVAGSNKPEQDGVFLCETEWEVGWFSRMRASTVKVGRGGEVGDAATVDVWAVDDVDVDDLVVSPEGYKYLPGVIEPRRLTLLRRDVAAEAFPPLA
jgi:hypothetical protein